jgi:hypothetical protein
MVLQGWRPYFDVGLTVLVLKECSSQQDFVHAAFAVMQHIASKGSEVQKHINA